MPEAAALQEFLEGLSQEVPGAEGQEPTRALRTLTQIISGEILEGGQVYDLDAAEEALYLTAFAGPWELTLVSVQFYTTDAENNEVPDRRSKEVEIGYRLGARFHPFVEDLDYRGRGMVKDDAIKLGSNDQVYVRVKGQGKAIVEVRGVVL